MSAYGMEVAFGVCRVVAGIDEDFFHVFFGDSDGFEEVDGIAPVPLS